MYSEWEKVAPQSLYSIACGPGYSRVSDSYPHPPFHFTVTNWRGIYNSSFSHFPTLCNSAIRLKKNKERSEMNSSGCTKCTKTYICVSIFRIPYRTYDVKTSDFVRELFTIKGKSIDSSPPLFNYAYDLFTLPNNCQWHVRKCTYSTIDQTSVHFKFEKEAVLKKQFVNTIMTLKVSFHSKCTYYSNVWTV